MPLVYLSASSLLSEIKKFGQWSLIPLLRQSGISGLEIRHELLSELDRVLNRPEDVQKDADFHLVYSAPICLFDSEGRYNEETRKVMKQAGRLKCNIVKFPLGDYKATSSNLAGLQKALSECGKYCPNMIVTVENDQTEQGGRIAPLKAFLSCCEQENVPVFMTFDIGNWIYVDEDPIRAAGVFARFVRYIHVKHVDKRNDGFVTHPILDGSEQPYQKLLAMLPTNVPRCIEFPVLGNDNDRVLKLIQFAKVLSTYGDEQRESS